MTMIQALLGKKLNQTQKFLENGRRIPVTEIAVSDNVVLQAKTVAKDGYAAVQLGYGIKKNGTKPLLGHVKKAGLEKAPIAIKEVRVQDSDLPQQGDLVSVETVFKPGDIVDVTGTSKGKGFAGVVKRHHFRGGPKTHGQSDRHRAPGSIGQTTTPGRVYKGKRMAGWYQVTKNHIF
jgi:large subunit ribosomal protein L3